MAVKSPSTTLAATRTGTAAVRPERALDPAARSSVDTHTRASDHLEALLAVALPLLIVGAVLVIALWFLGVLPGAAVIFR